MLKKIVNIRVLLCLIFLVFLNMDQFVLAESSWESLGGSGKSTGSSNAAATNCDEMERKLAAYQKEKQARNISLQNAVDDLEGLKFTLFHPGLTYVIKETGERVKTSYANAATMCLSHDLISSSDYNEYYKHREKKSECGFIMKMVGDVNKRIDSISRIIEQKKETIRDLEIRINRLAHIIARDCSASPTTGSGHESHHTH